MIRTKNGFQVGLCVIVFQHLDEDRRFARTRVFPFPGVIGPAREFKTKLVELRYSFEIYQAIFEEDMLLARPFTQLRVKAVTLWHFTCNAGRVGGRVLVEVSKMKAKRPKVQNNSQ
jgi:hypothetical protein